MSDRLLWRLRNPSFGTETSERNLFAAAADEIERLRDILKSGAVCMSPTERVRWIDRAQNVLTKARGEGVQGITDCGPDDGCGECDVCRYLDFLEWSGTVGKTEGSTIERNAEIEAYLRHTYSRGEG